MRVVILQRAEHYPDASYCDSCDFEMPSSEVSASMAKEHVKETGHKVYVRYVTWRLLGPR